jgi:hypothetical protein
MGMRWEDPRPATEPVPLVENVNAWLLVMFLLLMLAPLALGLSR